MAITTEMGEYLVGAYLHVVEGCDFIEYNVRPPGGKLVGLNEIDVVGLNFEEDVAFVCEVTTHIRSLNSTTARIRKKLEIQRSYAKTSLTFMKTKRFMYWSPVVRKGLATELNRIRRLELVINADYTEKIDLLQKFAKDWSHDTGNPAFRLFQILAHLRRK